ncbi:hypothetical protein PHYBOEH_006489 [Phytophthora boehmeriae]|uniref:Uncharacterized protein n=1 Tax=Phytophthora boehmeriae TaxID=109152 RepID=A0A8T1WHP2_9STRA|nr:hypothetical protein PHYBOEH_006489 [Phytophthora boehmeriae]
MKVINVDDLVTRTIGSIVGSHWSATKLGDDADEVNSSEAEVTLLQILNFFRTPFGQLSFMNISTLKDATLSYMAASRGNLRNIHRCNHMSSVSSTDSTQSGGSSVADLKDYLDDQHTQINNVERITRYEINEMSKKLEVVVADNAELRKIVATQVKDIQVLQQTVEEQRSLMAKLYKKVREPKDRLSALVNGLRMTAAVAEKISDPNDRHDALINGLRMTAVVAEQ